jgi:predicted AlkP superfamily phosphohydrolase/phosphomutase
VLFIGVDGADWEIIQPLMQRGRLPHFAQIVRDGAAGELESIEPMLSPLLWTTMATGKLPKSTAS